MISTFIIYYYYHILRTSNKYILNLMSSFWRSYNIGMSLKNYILEVLQIIQPYVFILTSKTFSSFSFSTTSDPTCTKPRGIILFRYTFSFI